MWYFLPLVFIPSLIVLLLSKVIYHRHITLREWGLQTLGVVLGSLLSLGLIGLSTFMSAGDFSIFNGYVTDKAAVEVSCGHQYQCGEECENVTETDQKGNKTTRRVCEPIYCDEHNYDVDWRVYTTLGTWVIDRIDRQGLKTPPRWDIVEKEDPVSESRYVTNWLLLDKERFTAPEEIRKRYHDRLWEYPKPYDYYRYKRVLEDNGEDYDDIKIWLNNQLKFDGAEKQLNVIIVVTENASDYYYALMDYWKGTRKNDVILFYGVDQDENVVWSRAMSFADGQGNLIMLKTLESMTINRQFGIDLVKEQYKYLLENYQRIPNKTFAYLKDNWTVPTWWAITVAIINLLAAIGVAYFVIKEDVA